LTVKDKRWWTSPQKRCGTTYRR